jgi:hypothetical protein
MLAARTSHLAALLEGDPRLRPVARDDVVEDLNAEEGTCGCEASRESEVLRRGLGIARRMTMSYDQTAGAGQDCRAEELARVDEARGRAVDLTPRFCGGRCFRWAGFW